MASRYDGRGDAPTITRRRHVLACARCRARRVKCDRGQPACSNCVKVGALCQPVQQSPAQHPALPSRPGSREPVDHNRLYKLEEQVARLSREVDSKSPSREPSRSPPPHQDADGHLPTRQAGIVKGASSTYLSPYSWAAAAKEIVQLEALLGDATLENSGRTSSTAFHGDILPMVDEGMHESLLRVYAQRVDPLVRILHWPTFMEKSRSFRQRTLVQMQPTADPNYAAVYGEPTTAAAFANPTTGLAPRAMSAKSPATFSASESASGTLLYSVYFAALTSVQHGPHPPELGSSTDCMALWSTLKKDLSHRIGLLGGQYAQTESVDMLQAMVLFISMELGAADPKAQWLQLGTAIRIAQSLGVHRDPADFGLDAIEIETRRRLWAQICILDARLAEYLCREPSIVPASYDTILPLSISDHDLVEIHQQATHNQENETYLQILRNVEKAQEHMSPFTSMTFMLIDAEMARQQQQLQCSNYQARDLTSSLRDSPQSAKKRNLPSGRIDQPQSANALRTLFTMRYNWDRLDCSDPLQYLISELCQINILKVKFITRSPRGSMGTTPTSVPSEHSEILSIFHDALQLATRCAALVQQYSGSPYNWYTRRLREVHSSSFLAALLVSRHPLSHEDTNSAWAVLDQLFPSDTNGNLLETEWRDTLLGKILEKARAKRGLQVRQPVAQQIRHPTMHPTTGHYPPQVLPNTSAVPSTAVTMGSGFQSSGNLFEDWDALMQEPVWSNNIPVTESNYWSHTQTSSSSLDTPSRPPPQRYNQRLYGQTGQSQTQQLPTPPVIPSQYRAYPQRQLPTIDISTASRRNDSFSSPYGVSTAVIGTGSHWSTSPLPSTPTYPQTYIGGQGQDDFTTSPQLAHAETWSVPASDQLQVPRGTGRERSNSQPTYSNVSRSPSESVMKRRSASNLGDRPDDFQQGFR